MSEEKFHFYENSNGSSVKFTAAVSFDSENGIVKASYAFTNPLDQFIKAKGRGIAYSRLNRRPMLVLEEIPSKIKLKTIVSTVRNFGLNNAEELRKFIVGNSVSPDGKNKVDKTKYVGHRQ